MENGPRFIDNLGSFEFRLAGKIKGLYFPLANEKIISSVSPDLHGDIKTDKDAFLLTPVSRQDLIDSRASRNFWVYIDKDRIWSASGVSKDLKQVKGDKFSLSAGLLWHKISRWNNKIGLKSEILSFVPADGEPVEVMQVTLTNISRRKISFIPTAAIPIYARGAGSIRDHRHVTSLLNRIKLDKLGVVVKPTLIFDESGHEPNKNYYFVLGRDRNGKAPQYIYPTQEAFCGEGGDLEAPESVLNNSTPNKKLPVQGREAMGAMRFSRLSLSPGRSCSYIIVMGITDNAKDIKKAASRFSNLKKAAKSLEETKKFWQAESAKLKVESADKDFDQWMRWVSIQPVLRRIFGCSFLPDFDYGKGGRGWRDLWQDCLGLILNNPQKLRSVFINNFSGVRMDGSNATIIGKNPGEFIADRNDIARVWMDHGVWPLITLDLYINETGDLKILFEEIGYFCDRHINRSDNIDHKWNEFGGNKLKDASGRIYKGSILEHLLVENLVQFLNVGEHNHIRLEGADWNDGLDMARQNGESVAFSAMYAYNLARLSELLLKAGKSKIKIAKEMKLLLAEVDYDSWKEKRLRLKDYFAKTANKVSGEKIEVDAQWLSFDLKMKSVWITQHIRRSEWLKEGFFNGYYDNKKERVEGRRGGLVRMSLVSQVFSVMSAVAQNWQVEEILKSAKKYLLDKRLKGYHLNTDFKKELPGLGRAFSFSYGDKENGAFFNHMIAMYAYALYKRGFAKEGWEVLSSIYKMARDTEKSRIYPCLPEYFNSEGRGMYLYLTGSASWFMLTLITQAFGIKGRDGGLCIEPNLVPEQFKAAKTISAARAFAGRKLKVSFSLAKRSSKNKLKILRSTLNQEELNMADSQALFIPRSRILKLSRHKLNLISILLG